MMFKEKIRTHLDLLSIPSKGEKMSKRLGGIIGCKYKTSSWHLLLKKKKNLNAAKFSYSHIRVLGYLQ